jgi:hypothetical protein
VSGTDFTFIKLVKEGPDKKMAAEKFCHFNIKVYRLRIEESLFPEYNKTIQVL